MHMRTSKSPVTRIRIETGMSLLLTMVFAAFLTQLRTSDGYEPLAFRELDTIVVEYDPALVTLSRENIVRAVVYGNGDLWVTFAVRGGIQEGLSHLSPQDARQIWLGASNLMTTVRVDKQGRDDTGTSILIVTNEMSEYYYQASTVNEPVARCLVTWNSNIVSAVREKCHLTVQVFGGRCYIAANSLTRFSIAPGEDITASLVYSNGIVWATVLGAKGANEVVARLSTEANAFLWACTTNCVARFPNTEVLRSRGEGGILTIRIDDRKYYYLGSSTNASVGKVVQVYTNEVKKCLRKGFRVVPIGSMCVEWELEEGNATTGSPAGK